MRKPVVLLALVALIAGCSDDPPKEDIPIDQVVVPTTASAVPTTASAVPTTSAAPADFAPKVSEGALRTKAIPPSALLGSDWKGPAKLSKGFPAIDRYVQNCSQSSTLKSRHESLKPPTGAYGFYDNVDENTSLNQVSTAAGVDTIARASAFLDFLRTVPQACPTGKALDKFPYRLTAEDGTGGDEELRLRMSITLPGPGEPLVIDMGYVRTGGLVISFYGESRQVDEYLPIATEFATGNLAGTVAGV
ncbi:hypothetical protein [Paractinoplanes durhamensis]|uniref:Sensor domain-containing protein n=1 Tax=Paractinoplanes durhamensis TaxID=113563 RepID=A0ABQ3Z9Q1_9ACTN|nr:hypothetical protein [Actinoplanes durhamensis]GIE06547.1 hypothetical protein Adu01nite_78970 [Actinoplanes durhamensis]